MEEKRRKELDAILDEWLGVTNDVKEMARGRRPACAEILRDPDEVDWDRVRERASAMAKRFCELDLCSYGALAYLSDDEWSGVGSDRRALLYEVCVAKPGLEGDDLEEALSRVAYVRARKEFKADLDKAAGSPHIELGKIADSSQAH